MKTAIVFGATGQTGTLLTDYLLNSNEFDIVKIIVRKATGKQHPKLHELVNPLTNPEFIQNEIRGDVLFCCLGTTIRKAGCQENFNRIDYSLPLSLAKIAKRNNIPCMVTISSVGANAQSNNFYIRVKGEMERDIAAQDIERSVFVRPSLLLGKREELRMGEMISKWLMPLFNPLFLGKLKRYKAIQSSTVARAMVALALENEKGVRFVENEELFDIGR
jgi:uncharacterized protein YbjT (DUF2867 family)